MLRRSRTPAKEKPMHAVALRCLAAAATALIVGGATASEPLQAACELPASDLDPLADRAGILAQYELLPRACLQTIFQACTEESSRTLLDFGSAATCSFGYEALLKKGFGGSFGALLAWWRSQRQGAGQ